jgi:AhpD family alkylhydroperoxidase
MEKELNLSNAIKNRQDYKVKFSLWEFYQAFIYLPTAITILIKNNKKKILTQQFIERLQLAVTEVNGCPACSYQHTKMALKLGMSNEEISSFLNGSNDYVIPHESKAILFAQHFADTKGNPKKYTYLAIVKEYGEEKAEIINAATQVMLMGNIYGIPLSAFISRIKKSKYTDSSIFYELSMLLGGLIIIPVAILHGLFRQLIGLPNKRLDKSEDGE